MAREDYYSSEPYCDICAEEKSCMMRGGSGYCKPKCGPPGPCGERGPCGPCGSCGPCGPPGPSGDITRRYAYGNLSETIRAAGVPLEIPFPDNQIVKNIVITGPPNSTRFAPVLPMGVQGVFKFTVSATVGGDNLDEDLILQIRKNGINTPAQNNIKTPSQPPGHLSTDIMVKLVMGDYLDVILFGTDGDNQNISRFVEYAQATVVQMDEYYL